MCVVKAMMCVRACACMHMNMCAKPMCMHACVGRLDLQARAQVELLAREAVELIKQALLELAQAILHLAHRRGRYRLAGGSGGSRAERAVAYPHLRGHGLSGGG